MDDTADPIAIPPSSQSTKRLTSRLAHLAGVVALGIAAVSLKLVGLFPGYAKVSKEALLEHDTRAAVIARIQEDPGTTAAELSEDLDIPYNTVDYHVRRLQQESLVAHMSTGRRRHLFPANVAPRDRRSVAMLRNANTGRLLGEIRVRPGSHQRALAAAVGIQPTSLAWHLARLQEADLVRSERCGRTIVWYATGNADVSRP